jgi:hypothetical protein
LARANSSGRQQNVRDTCEVEQTLGRQRRPRRPLAAEKATKESCKDKERDCFKNKEQNNNKNSRIIPEN